MSLNEIIDRFTLVSGLEMKDVSRFLPIISECMEYFDERTANGLSTADHHRAVHACAVYAYYRICSLGKDAGLNAFKAGDVQFNMSDMYLSAQRLWMEEQANIADIVDVDGGFSFRAVEI